MTPVRSRTLPLAGTALAVLGLVVLAGAAAPPAYAQIGYFGKNKVTHRDFRWRTLESRHFQVYFYPEEEELARTALRLGEAAYGRVAARFRHEVPRRVPLVVYSSHADFEQTNVSPYFLPEGVAGFTEFLKGRVAMPFNGSYADFAETLEHELVHVFQMSRLDETYRLHYAGTAARPPLWFTEGHADHWAEGWDSQAEFVVRDLVVHDRVPDIEDLWVLNGTFTLYKIGQHLVGWLEETWGPDVVPRIYDSLWRWGAFEYALEEVTGTSLAELNTRWKFALKQRFFPAVEDHDPVSLAARPLAVDGPSLHAAVPPAGTPLPDDAYFFVSPRNGFTNLYRASLAGPEREVTQVVKGGRSPDFESLRPGQSSIDVSSRGHLAFVARHQDRDALYLFDPVAEAVLGRWQFEGLVALQSPSFDPEGEAVVFAALHESGRQDLYLFRFAADSLRALTRDRFQESDPAWSPDGRTVVFATDHNPWGNEGKRNLVAVDVATGAERTVTAGPWSDTAPAWSPDGERLVYVSDRSGTPQLHVLGRDGRSVQVSSLLGAVSDPTWLPAGNEVVFTAYAEGRFGIHRLVPEAKGDTLVAPGEFLASLDPAGAPGAGEEPVGVWESRAVSADSVRRAVESPYRPRYTLDLAQAAVAFEPGRESGQGIQAVVSDQLGDRLMFVQLANTSSDFSDVVGRLSASATFWNLSRRVDRGLSVYSTAGDYTDEVGLPYYERRSGVSVVGAFPFDRYLRTEASVGVLYSDREADSFRPAREGLLAVNYLSFIHDTSLWFPTGPMDGGRANLTLGLTTNLEKVDFESFSVSLDARRYLRTGLRSAYAVRLMARFSEGSYPTRWVMGGSWDLRLYPRREFVGTRSVLLNQEWRLPLLRGIALGLPIGTMTLPGVEFVPFLDIAQVWDEGERPGSPLGSFGFGLRSSLGGILVLRLDVGKRTDFRTVRPRTEVDFFVGYDY